MQTGLAKTLESVAASLAAGAGFRTVAINLHRPAFDDYEVVVVHGSEAARTALLGTAIPMSDWQPFMCDAYERRGSYFVRQGAACRDDLNFTYVPELVPNDDPDAWRAEDALFVPLRGSGGHLLGILSVDEPVDGRRPTDAQLDQLGAVALQAALAVESAQHADAAGRHRVALEHLLRVSAGLAGCETADAVLDIVCDGIRDALGFATVVVALTERRGPDGPVLRARATRGWTGDALPDLPVDVLDAVLGPQHRVEGCSLLEADVARALVPPWLADLYRSSSNGRGANAWNHHWLVVPLEQDSELAGIIWVDDPLDRLLPGRERLQALRAFAHMAANALESVRRLGRLHHLAQHDPLTGLRNRRGLLEHIEVLLCDGDVAVVVFDVDHFKRVNDQLGYEVGDRVLTTFARVLEEERRLEDVAARLGGEEFALVLRGANEHQALACAERVRRRLAGRVGFVPWGLTVSAGVATSARSGATAADLSQSANRALVAAKRLGRNRCVVHAPDTVDVLLESLDAGVTDREQTAAVLLLAETVDLRDPATARHSLLVGRYAEAIGRELGLDAGRVERLRTAGLLHDLGKLAVADSILHKPGSLTGTERAEVERHCELGARILERAGLDDVAGWVLAHHERLDGAGYPRGLAADAIPLEARILAVADAYEAMTANRAYRSALPEGDARAELAACTGSQFDPDVVAAFVRVLDRAFVASR